MGYGAQPCSLWMFSGIAKFGVWTGDVEYISA